MQKAFSDRIAPAGCLVVFAFGVGVSALVVFAVATPGAVALRCQHSLSSVAASVSAADGAFEDGILTFASPFQLDGVCDGKLASCRSSLPELG